MDAREFDIVLLGATGFAGGHAAARLSAAAPAGLTWAVAGRRADALSRLSDRYSCGTVHADVNDLASMARLAHLTRVVLNTAGPFAKYGDSVVDACVSGRTHYADITGEVPFMRGLIDRHHKTALRDGTAILPAAGFDSVPAEIAAFAAMGEAAARGGTLESLRTVYRLRGGLNGGTLASVIHIFEHGDRRLLADPYSLVPACAATGSERRALGDPTRPVFDATAQSFVAPFFMGAINRRVVRRMIELARASESPAVAHGLTSVLDPAFRYDEFQSVSKGRGWFAAWMATASLGAGAGLLSSCLGRKLVRRLGPRAGEGPSEKTLQRGLTQMASTARMTNGESFVVRQNMKGDPGNAATVRILVEVGLALAAGEAAGGGVLTPLSAFGQGLVDRLSLTGEHSIEV